MLTALQLSKKILEETKIPMNPEEIWNYSVSNDYVKDCKLSGKTPPATIGAQIYMDIIKNDSEFYKYSTRPQKFGLVKLKDVYSDSGTVIEPPAESKHAKSAFSERDLHPLLVAYVRSNEHFYSYAKTLYHEKSAKSGKNAEKWLHPDIVAVHYAFEDLNKNVVNLAKDLGESVVDLYSFELKKEITSENVREYYFQAVSNSSWANEGYLVAPKISEEALVQLGKLNSSFGIGVIKLNLDDVYQSEILIPSDFKESIDLNMIDELSTINPDFREFIVDINKALKINEAFPKHYDEVMDSEKLAEYIERKQIR